MLELIKQPWPWYISGPLIGMMVPVLLLCGNKQFGISSTIRDFCAVVVSKKIEYFRYNVKDELWRNILVLGIIFGGMVSLIFLDNDANIHISDKTVSQLEDLGISDFRGLVPSEIFGLETFLQFKGIIIIITGGFLIGFGTRYADGCTSGHAIMGLSLFSRSSLVAVSGFFTGGLISTHFIIPLIFR